MSMSYRDALPYGQVLSGWICLDQIWVVGLGLAELDLKRRGSHEPVARRIGGFHRPDLGFQVAVGPVDLHCDLWRGDLL